MITWCSLSSHYQHSNPCKNKSIEQSCRRQTTRLYPYAGCGSFSVIQVPSIKTYKKVKVDNFYIHVAYWFRVLLIFTKFEMTYNTLECERFSVLILKYASSYSTPFPSTYKHFKSMCGTLPAINLTVRIPQYITVLFLCVYFYWLYSCSTNLLQW